MVYNFMVYRLTLSYPEYSIPSQQISQLTQVSYCSDLGLVHTDSVKNLLLGMMDLKPVGYRPHKVC